MTNDPAARDGQAGLEVEGRVRATAAELGVADFVYLPLYVMRGRAKKEISDGLLICGGRGAILQVKSRGVSVASGDSDEQARRWVSRELRAAIKQARGSRKELARLVQQDGAVTVRPLRSRDMPVGRHHELDFELTADPSAWPLVVVLDHPRLPLLRERVDDDVFVVTRTDWIGFMTALRSVAGALEYISRCLESRSAYEPDIGDEWSRFLTMCAADQSTADHSVTWVPWLSLAALDDSDAADWYQHVIDRSWPVGSPLPSVPPAQHRAVAEFLDEVPPTVRVEIGARWRTYAQRTRHGGQASGLALMPGKAIFVMIHHSPSAELPPKAMSNRVRATAAVRAWEVAETIGPRPVLAVGAFIHPGATDYLFAHVEVPRQPDPELIGLVHDDVGPLRVPGGVDRLRT